MTKVIKQKTQKVTGKKEHRLSNKMFPKTLHCLDFILKKKKSHFLSFHKVAYEVKVSDMADAYVQKIFELYDEMSSNNFLPFSRV